MLELMLMQSISNIICATNGQGKMEMTKSDSLRCRWHLKTDKTNWCFFLFNHFENLWFETITDGAHGGTCRANIFCWANLVWVYWSKVFINVISWGLNWQIFWFKWRVTVDDFLINIWIYLKYFWNRNLVFGSLC